MQLLKDDETNKTAFLNYEYWTKHNRIELYKVKNPNYMNIWILEMIAFQRIRWAREIVKRKRL